MLARATERAFEIAHLFVAIVFMLHTLNDTLLITQKLLNKNFSGGSLGSYVDEGRSKMRELV